MLSSAARTIWAFPLARVRPLMTPRAAESQCGAPEPDERGNDVNSAGIGHAFRQRFGFRGGPDQSQFIAQPLDHRARDKHAAFHGELRRGADGTPPAYREADAWNADDRPPACVRAKHPVP